MATWPNASNTGVPDGVTLLPSGGITVSKAGTTISGLNITGPVYINASNVTLENCKITSSNYAVVEIAKNATGVVVQDCEINGVGSGNDGSHGIAGQGTFLRNNIYNVENGINLQGNGSVIQDNYIHDLKASGSPHYDGIQIDGGISNTTISHNTVINDHGQTSAVMIDNYFGPISNIKVDNNVLVGGGYTVYSDGSFNGGSISGVSFTNNHIGTGGYGDTDFVGNKPVYTGNVDDGDSIIKNLGSSSSSSGGSTTTPPPSSGSGTSGSGTSGSGTSGSGSGTSGSGSGTSGSGSGTTGSGSTSGGHHTGSGTTHTGGSTTPTTGSTTITGTNSADHLAGDNHNNVINGLGGDDTISGSGGRDTMTGGAGNDHFVFGLVSVMGTTEATRDIITDFTPGHDKIDLSGIDANVKTAGNAAFKFIAGDNASFTHHAGELAWRTDAAHHETIIQGDTNGDGVHDFEIQLNGTMHLTASDFIL